MAKINEKDSQKSSSNILLRKFAGSMSGRIDELIETCKLNVVEPYAYLKTTLEAIAAGHPAAPRIDDAHALEL